MIKRCLAVLLSVAFLAPSVALAQQPKAGVVTTLEGNVSARRVALPNPVPLKFKDDVLLQDTVTTGDKSLARMLLGGKAVVTVRERSVLTITEVPGRSTIDLETGKFALAVAREKMRPGEEIQIRTANAVAGVRGTVVITEVNRQSAQLGTAAPAVVTNFYVLRGTITAQQIDPGTRQPVGAPLQVGTLQAYSGAGNAAPRVAPVPPEQMGQITSGLQPSGPKGGEGTGQEQVKAQSMQTATTLLTVLTGGPDSQVAFATVPTVNTASTTTTAQTNATPKLAFTSEITKAQELASESTASQAATAAGLPRSFSSAFTSSSTSALVSLSGETVTLTGTEVNAIEVLSGGDVSLAGPLLTLKNSTLTTTGKLFEIENGKLTSTSSSALFSFDPSTITVEDVLIGLNGGALTLAGPLLTDTNGTLEGDGEFLRMKSGSTLKSTGTGALVQLSGTTVDFTAALSMTDSTMTLSGPLASVTSVKGAGTDSSSSTPLFQLDASTLTSTGTGALISFTSTDADPDGNFFRLQNKSTVELAGPLFSGTGGKLGSGTSSSTRAFILFLDSSTLKSTGTSALLSLSGVTFDAQGPFFNIRRSLSASSPTKVTLAGPLASISDSTVNTTTTGFGSTFGTSASSCCSTFGVEQGAVLTGTGSGALISVANSTVTIADSQSGGSFFVVTDTVTGFPSSELVAPSKVTLEGPLLSATSSSTIKPLFDLLAVFRSTLSSTTSSALISLTSSTVAAGGNDISGTATPFARMLTLRSSATADTAASAASISLSGPFMSATGSTLSGVQFAGIFNGASFTSTSTSALVSLDNTSLTLSTITQGSTTERGHFLNIGGRGSTSATTFAKMDLKGPLLSVSNGGTLTLSGSLVNVFEGGEIIEAHPTSPFVSITGGTQKLASDSTLPLLGLFGRSSATTSETISTSGLATSTSTLTLGTDQPLQRSGSGAYLELSNATVTAEKGLNLDDALLSASAPLLLLKSSASLTTAADALNLTGAAKLTATGPLVKLDGGTFTVTSGHAIRVMGGSFLNVTGDLISILNSGKLDVKNGAALFISGGSVVKITGGLLNFNNDASGQAKITNSLCSPSPCSSQGGVTFLLQNSATSSNLSITNGVKNASAAQSSNLLSSGNAAAIVLDGANSKVIISGN